MTVEVAASPVGVAPAAVSWARRTLDVAVAAGALVVLAPVLLVTALAVKVSSRGPVLFRQVRLGEHRREFTILKFRTMSQAGPAAGPQVTARRDARITAVGRLLRRTSLDELPQLLNVLRGQMTLVGPRPETPALADRYPVQCRWVLDHRPGLTGPTQVRFRDFNSIPAEVTNVEEWYLDHLVAARVDSDATYLAHPSVAATLAVLFATGWHLLTP